MIYIYKDSLNTILYKNILELSLEHKIIDNSENIADSKSNIILKKMSVSNCRPCPATKLYNCCNYYNTDVMEGCPFDCSYCILQSYLQHKSIIINSDTEATINNIKDLINLKEPLRIGTGELSDSLALDNIFPFSKILSPIINNQEIIQFEYKTKSANIKNLLDLNPRNIVISWSINPQKIVDSEEKGAAPVKERIDAASICAAYGYKVGFHFDPIIYYDGYEKDYREVVNYILEKIPEKSVEYISLSTFRGTTSLISEMRSRKLPSSILASDLIHAEDGKIRYFRPLRTEMMKKVSSYIRKEWKKAFIYLCMERENVWMDVLGILPSDRIGTEKLFPWYSK